MSRHNTGTLIMVIIILTLSLLLRAACSGEEKHTSCDVGGVFMVDMSQQPPVPEHVVMHAYRQCINQ